MQRFHPRRAATRPRLAAVVVFVLAACSAPPPYVTPADHPANPAAATAPLPKFGAELDGPIGAAAAQPVATPAEDALYRCPMHPTVVKKEPGRCPICGMALEKAPPHDHSKEHRPEGGR